MLKKVINLSVRVTTTFIRIYMNAKLKQIIETIIYLYVDKKFINKFSSSLLLLQF